MVQIQLKQKGKNRKLRIAKVRTKWESNILVADLFLTSGYVSAWKHVAGIKLCARTAEALEDLLIQIAQAYLAQGAVIPPNKEFMAVLGDQKSGNNIEAPESLIRRIVREESGNGKGSTYNVTAQVNRRTLFDLVLEEGKVRRTVTGRNPFETV